MADQQPVADVVLVDDLVEKEPSFRAFVGNMSYETTAEDLALFCKDHGVEIVRSNIIFRNGYSLGYGFLEFAAPEQLDNAIKALSNLEIAGRTINVEVAREKRMDQPRRGRGRGRRGRGRGRRNFRDETIMIENRQPEDATPAYAGGFRGRGRGFRGRGRGRGRGRRARVPDDRPREPSQSTLFLGNLPYQLEEPILLETFSSIADVKSVKIVRRANNSSKGFGFVEFSNQEEQLKALEKAADLYIDGRLISVKIAMDLVREVIPEQQDSTEVAQEELARMKI